METLNEKIVKAAKTAVTDSVVINYNIEDDGEEKKLFGNINSKNKSVGGCYCSLPSASCNISISENSGLTAEDIALTLTKFSEDVKAFFDGEKNKNNV